MLPSRGYFKKNDCPFYDKGLCKRPHCHFRHRKKVVNEITSNANSQDLLLLKNNVGGNDNDCVTSETNETDSEIINENNINLTQGHSVQDQQNQDSLFAKLVNQSNPYEKINRHIPCAYTPTPQTRGVQPKSKTLSSTVIKSNEKTKENSGKNCSNNYYSVNNVQDDRTLGATQNQDFHNIESNVSKKINSEPSSKCLYSSSKNNLTENLDDKNLLLDNKNLDSLSYEPQSISKSVTNHLNNSTAEGYTSNYIPSKMTIPESQYLPFSNSNSLPDNYIPSKDNKPQTMQYVPNSNVSIENEITYKPSNKASSEETKYQPGNSGTLTSYIPTEKSAIKAQNNQNNKTEWTDFEFISSEIEMMKKLLDDETSNKTTVKGQTSAETEFVEEQEKSKKSKSSTSKTSHSSSTGHKSSHSHSSSKSKHSDSSGTSKHSNHSKSNSSRHHRSSSSSHKSKSSEQTGKTSSSGDQEKNSSSLKSGKHHHSRHKSHKRSKESDSNHHQNSENTKKKKMASSNDDSDGAIFEEEKKNSANEIESKKRKNFSSDEERDVKILKNEEDEILIDLEDDPDTIEKECLEIFNSYSNSSENETTTVSQPNESQVSAAGDEYDSLALGKKRTAHSSPFISDHSVLRNKTVKRNNIKSAQEIMLERYKVIEKAKEIPNSVPVQSAPILGLNKPAVRIAAVSNIQQLLNAKKAIQEKIDQGLKVKERTTIAHTVTAGGSRVAHTPASKFAKVMVEKPTIKEGSKQIPVTKRQIYLDKLLLETNQIYPTKEESAEEALRLEEEIYRSHSNSFPAYHAAYMSTLIKTRRKLSALKGETSHLGTARPKMSHNEVLSGGKKNFSVIKTKKVDIGMLSERHIYEELLRCKLTPEELKENSYPIDGDKPGYATCVLNMELKYNAHYAHIKKMSGNRRYCIRCSKQYEVDPKTLKQLKEGPGTCSYHPGKKKSGGRNSERIYNCCNSSSTEGCATHVRHVTDCNNYENLPNCVKTFSKKHETNPGIYALDCEMVYTRLGYELARVTVVNLKKEIVYDTLVKPKYPVDCYNTFYSGIEEKMLDGVKTTLKDVQAVLLSMFSDKTILIGHSLDSDLRALHLIHDTIVDTAVVYKNEKYYPYKYSLKDLCARKISKIIQDNVGGHDSAEDATAALEIMLNHVKEEVSKYDSLESYEADRMT